MNQPIKKIKRIKVLRMPAKNQTVIFSNNFFQINVSQLSIIEHNLMRAIFCYAKSIEKTQIKRVLIQDLKKDINLSLCSNLELQKIIDKAFAKIATFGIQYENPEKKTAIPVFKKLVVNIKKERNPITKRNEEVFKSIEFEINEAFYEWFNSKLLYETKSGYTSYSLESFVKLKSKYSKIIFEYLMKFKSTGFWKISIEKFKEIIGKPDLDNKFIDSQILTKPKEELPKIFKDLEIFIAKDQKFVREIIFQWSQIYQFNPPPKIQDSEVEKIKNKISGYMGINSKNEKENPEIFDDLEKYLEDL